jgi:hypothetical protein
MAYNNKYYFTFPNLKFGHTWTAYIAVDGFSGLQSPLVGSGEPVFVDYEKSEQNLFSPLRSSSCTFEVVESTDDSLIELFAKDKVGLVKVYLSGALFWTGWTICDDYNSITYALKR